MYIVFDLQFPLGSLPVTHIIQALDQWCERYQVTDYRTRIVRNHLRVTFDDESLYALFALTWMPGDPYSVYKFELIEPMKK